MRKTKLRKHSKSPLKSLQRKADIALQEFYRQTETKCEGCGARAELRHHFILKSHSNRLRYEEKNLIPLCKSCHSKIHCFGQGQMIEAKIALGRGEEWIKELQKLSKEHITFLKADYLKIIKGYGKRKT
jgi:hypothetical protein